MSGVLQYLENPYKILDRVLCLNFEFVLIDRTYFMRSGKDRYTIQHVPESIYKAWYSACIFSEKHIKSVFTKHGYELVQSISEDGILIRENAFTYTSTMAETMIYRRSMEVEKG